jgi:hypothetical protein
VAQNDPMLFLEFVPDLTVTVFVSPRPTGRELQTARRFPRLSSSPPSTRSEVGRIISRRLAKKQQVRWTERGSSMVRVLGEPHYQKMTTTEGRRQKNALLSVASVNLRLYYKKLAQGKRVLVRSGRHVKTSHALVDHRTPER